MPCSAAIAASSSCISGRFLSVGSEVRIKRERSPRIPSDKRIDLSAEALSIPLCEKCPAESGASAIAQSTINMLGDSLRNAKIACISPITAAVVEKNGFPVAAIAEPYTMEGLVEAIMRNSECGIRN